MREIDFPNTNTFFIELQSVKEKSEQSKRKILSVEKSSAVGELASKAGKLTLSEKNFYFNKILEVCTKIENDFSLQSVEQEFLSSFVDEIKKYITRPTTLNQNLYHVFRNDNQYLLEFVVNTLYDFNAIDKSNIPRRGFQAVANAIFSSKNYKEHVFKYNIQLKEYIDFLNNYFNAKIGSKSKLSDGSNHIDTVDIYFSTHFNLNEVTFFQSE